jgi:hypothetical protein
VDFTDNGDGTATLAGTPSTSGSYPITITASNGVSPDYTQSFTLTVNEVISFDDLTAGAVLNSQYAADGVTFGVAAPFQAPSATMVVVADRAASSPPNDVWVQCGEVCQTSMWAEFSSPQQQVSIYLNNTGVSGTVSSAVNAYDGNGNLIASMPFTAPPGQWQQVSVNDPAGSIIYVEVANAQGVGGPAFSMDNFSFN